MGKCRFMFCCSWVNYHVWFSCHSCISMAQWWPATRTGLENSPALKERTRATAWAGEELCLLLTVPASSRSWRLLFLALLTCWEAGTVHRAGSQASSCTRSQRQSQLQQPRSWYQTITSAPPYFSSTLTPGVEAPGKDLFAFGKV